jgi:hypothetical protein
MCGEGDGQEARVKIAQYRWSVMHAVALGLSLSMVLPLSSAAADEDADLKTETAGGRAHFAQELCAVSPERIAGYKTRLRKSLHADSDFDRHWQMGWTQAESAIGQMNSLRDRDPKEFAGRIKVNCERLKWMAENALRSPPAK